MRIQPAYEHSYLVFSHPDCTVGSGISPDHAALLEEWLADSTADQELEKRSIAFPHLAPKT